MFGHCRWLRTACLGLAVLMLGGVAQAEEPKPPRPQKPTKAEKPPEPPPAPRVQRFPQQAPAPAGLQPPSDSGEGAFRPLGGGTIDQPQAVFGRGRVGRKGAVLVFPKIEVRWADLNNDGSIVWDEMVQDTFVQLSNDGPDATWVKLFMVNGDGPLDEPGVRRHRGWTYVNFTARLTRENAVYWSAFSGLPGFRAGNSGGVTPWRILDIDQGINPGRPDPLGSSDRVLRGYIIAWPITPNELPNFWNHMSGNVTVVNYANDFAYEYEPYAFQAIGTGPNDPNQPTTNNHQLDFDGVMYEAAPGMLLLDFYADTEDPNDFEPQSNEAFSLDNEAGRQVVTVKTELSLAVLSADFTLLTGAPTTTAGIFNVWNQNESRLSFDQPVCVTCWRSQYLRDILLQFRASILGTDRGKARIKARGGIACPDVTGDGLNEWADDTALLGVATKFLRFEAINRDEAAASPLVVQLRDTQSSSIRFEPVLGSGNLDDLYNSGRMDTILPDTSGLDPIQPPRPRRPALPIDPTEPLRP